MNVSKLIIIFLFLFLVTSSCVPKLEKIHDVLLLVFISDSSQGMVPTNEELNLNSHPEGMPELKILPNPLLSPLPGIFSGDTTVTISLGLDSPAGTTLRFMESGIQPNCNTIGVEYTTPVNILFTDQLHAIACHSNTQEWIPSNVVGGEYTHPRLNRIALGDFYSCALTNSGNVKCWGRGFSGRLGYESTTNRGHTTGTMPPPNVNVGGNVRQIATGGGHTCALMDTGAVRCWGLGIGGQLGYESTTNRGHTTGTMPPPNVNVGGNVKQIATGGSHTCALLDTGHVRCWGEGLYGKLGYENTTNIGDTPGTMPPPNVNVGGTVKQIATGLNHTCALLTTGQVRCWGYGGDGQLGYENTLDVGATPGTMPPPNVNVGGTVKQISAGGSHTCALLTTGHVRCWGYGYDGQLGYENNLDKGNAPGTMPPPNVNVGGTVKQISAGYYHTCALMDTGHIRCWGYNTNGQLGYENTSNVGHIPGTMPPPNVNVGGTVKQIVAGGAHTCAFLETGNIRCWGMGSFGRLGYENTSNVGHSSGTMPPPNVNY